MPWRTVIAWLLVLPLAGWVVLRAFGLERGYPMVPVLAYTPLAVAGAVAASVLTLLLRRRAASVAAALLAVALAGFVAPRALGGPSSAEGGSGPRLEVLTANLYQQPRAARSVVDVIRRERPDVVSLQEVTPRVAGGARRGRDRSAAARSHPGHARARFRVGRLRPPAVGARAGSRRPDRYGRAPASWRRAVGRGALGAPARAATRGEHG